MLNETVSNDTNDNALPVHSVSDYVEINIIGVLLFIAFPINIYSLYLSLQKYCRDGPKSSSFLLLKLHLTIANLMVLSFYGVSQFIWLITFEVQ
jgi:hypothetical protein